MRTSDFEYELPQERIAQHPATERDQARLLVQHRASNKLEHRKFRDLAEYLRPGDVLVLNDSRVIPARLRGLSARNKGQFEVLLVQQTASNDWWVLLRPGKRARVGTQILFKDIAGRVTEVRADVVDTNDEGHRRLRFAGTSDISKELDRLGETPLPPYILREGIDAMDEDQRRYQTVFAKHNGSVAAPTAGLHFTTELLEQIRSSGVRLCFVTLHVGLGTFAPVKTEIIADHVMHEERYALGEETVRSIHEAKSGGGKVFAVGTTVLRVLESVADRHQGRLLAESGKTGTFIYPPHDFKIVDALITNFHLPRSTLLMLVSAFAAPNQTCGREMILSTYAEAVRLGYRFYSYGDAMLLM